MYFRHCMALVHTDQISLDAIPNSLTAPYGVSASMLRLDRIHPVISGNKWFKLRYYLEQMQAQGKKRLVTWGGAWSNHIVATAAACHDNGLQSLGLIRGEKAKELSATLKEAEKFGMQFQFLSREDYRNKNIAATVFTENDWMVAEGGYGELGAKGASTITAFFNSANYTHILCAVGTGTMIAGIINGVTDSTQVLGIPVLKGAETISLAIDKLVNPTRKNWKLVPGYEWGGYAKHPSGLIQFMNEFYATTKIPTDIVYTAKLSYAFIDLLKANYFPTNSRILIIHSGGLQGNRSLSNGELSFNEI